MWVLGQKGDRGTRYPAALTGPSAQGEPTTGQWEPQQDTPAAGDPGTPAQAPRALGCQGRCPRLRHTRQLHRGWAPAGSSAIRSHHFSASPAETGSHTTLSPCPQSTSPGRGAHAPSSLAVGDSDMGSVTGHPTHQLRGRPLPPQTKIITSRPLWGQRTGLCPSVPLPIAQIYSWKLSSTNTPQCSIQRSGTSDQMASTFPEASANPQTSPLAC